MSNITTRLFVVAALIAGAGGVSHWLRVPNDVELPSWSIEELPYQLGNWHGEDVKMDDTIAAATGAAVIVNRCYQTEAAQAVTIHTAMFTNPKDGVYHTPLNCYAANGWKKISDNMEVVQVADNLKISVRLIGWEKEGERFLVGFWYQLGNHVLYDRLDLGKVRAQMRGKSEWPVLIKVMLQTPLANPMDAQKSLTDFASTIGKWLNNSDHQKYLSKWGGI